MTEQWKTTRDYKDYDVSNLGQARSRKFGKIKILKPTNNGHGYPCVTLCANGKRKTHQVHRLVAEAFLDPCPEGHEVNHKDGVKHHNDATNLKWVTPAENVAHAEQMGLYLCGEQHGNSKLTTAQVVEMRRLHALGKTQGELGKIFETSQTNVGLIVRYEHWRHV